MTNQQYANGTSECTDMSKCLYMEYMLKHFKDPDDALFWLERTFCNKCPKNMESEKGE